MTKKQTIITIYLEDDEVKKCTINGKDVDPAASSTNGRQITINVNSSLTKKPDAQDSDEWDSESRVTTLTSVISLIMLALVVYWVFF